MDITRVEQEQKFGCVPACCAMILGKPYWEVADEFFTDFNKEGVKTEKAIRYLWDHGFISITKKLDNDTIDTRLREEIMKSFAPVHILSVSYFPDKIIQHCYIMTNSGAIINPTSNNENTTNKAYMILELTGFWPANFPINKK